jgi:hypothetical protein
VISGFHRCLLLFWFALGRLQGIQSAPRPPCFAGTQGRTCNEAACWLMAAAACVRRLPPVLLKSSVLTLCAQKVQVKRVPSLTGLVV